MAKYEKIGNYPIYFNRQYFLVYAGGQRELTEKDQKSWNKTLALPGILKEKEQAKLGYQNNPHAIPVSGMDLLSFIKELNFIPLFDKFFEQTGVVTLTELAAYEAIKSKTFNDKIK